MASASPEIMTAREVAEYLRLSVQTVQKLARRGVLPGAKLEGRWRFPREAIEQVVRSGRRLTRPPGRPRNL